MWSKLLGFVNCGILLDSCFKALISVVLFWILVEFVAIFVELEETVCCRSLFSGVPVLTWLTKILAKKVNLSSVVLADHCGRKVIILVGFWVGIVVVLVTD